MGKAAISFGQWVVASGRWVFFKQEPFREEREAERALGLDMRKQVPPVGRASLVQFQNHVPLPEASDTFLGDMK